MLAITTISQVRFLLLTTFLLSFLFPFHNAFLYNNINHVGIHVNNNVNVHVNVNVNVQNARQRLLHHHQRRRHNRLIIPQHILNMLPPSLLVDSFDIMSTAYSDALQNYPLLTKSSTGFTLCGVADVLAQSRAMMMKIPKDTTTTTTTSAGISNNNNTNNNTNPSTSTTSITSTSTNNTNTSRKFLTIIQYIFNTIDYKRVIRFAIKGFFGAIVWSTWYDISDTLLPIESISSILSSTTTTINTIIYNTNSNSFIMIEEGGKYYNIILNIIKTTSLIIIEQFVACPIIFSTFEIPAATILNNAPLKRIPYEINDKLYDMLVANFKIWTWANIVIYNVPVQYRVGLSNVIDIFWQSIVADFAANCGNDNNDNIGSSSSKVRGGVDRQEECRIDSSSTSDAQGKVQVPLPFITKNNSNTTIAIKTSR